MPALIDSYTPTTSEALSLRRTYAVAEIRVEQKPTWYSSLSVRPFEAHSRGINSRSLRQLDSISKLEDNWDEDDALAPNESTTQQAKALIFLLDTIGQKIYNVAPGPRGEIMIDIRNQGKSVEVLFYPTKNKYVKFSQDNMPEQGLYSFEVLPQLITWLNGG